MSQRGPNFESPRAVSCLTTPAAFLTTSDLRRGYYLSVSFASDGSGNPTQHLRQIFIRHVRHSFFFRVDLTFPTNLSRKRERWSAGSVSRDPRQMHTLSNVLLARSRFRNSLGKLKLPLGVCESLDRFKLQDPIFVSDKA